MNLNENAFNPQCTALEVKQYNDRYDKLYQLLQDQIINLNNKFSSDDFTNKFISELSKDKSIDSLTALCRVLNTYNAVSLLTNYPQEYMEIFQTVVEFENLLKTRPLLMYDEKAVLTELNNVSMCNN